MKMRMIISGMFILCGSVLIVFSFHSNLIWDEGTIKFYNLSEAGLIYGLWLSLLGLVLMLLRNMSVFSFLWLSWLSMFGIQLLRIHPLMTFVSHFMNSPKMFWGTIVLGVILVIATIMKKITRIL